MRRSLACLGVLALTASLPAALIQNFAGNGTKGLSGDGGPAPAAQLADPGGIARGPDGALYICDTANHRIRRVAPDGKISTFAGTGEKGWSGDGGPATAAKLAEPYEVRFDRAGNVYWVERLSHSVRRVDAKTGRIATIAGNGTPGFSGDGGPATAAQLNEPHSIGLDRAGDLYICDVKNHRIRQVAMKTGIITTLVGNGRRDPTPDGAKLGPATPVAGPRALDFGRDGTLWLALREGNAVYRLDLAAGTIHHVAGTGAKGFTGDGGAARLATFNGPKGIAVAPDGRVYVADTENHVIRVIDPRRGTIAVAAGTGVKGSGPAGGDPLACALNRPHGVFVDADGALYLGDTDAYVVRVVK
jgi:DNA-binding beta-propeller fold protein YncE